MNETRGVEPNPYFDPSRDTEIRCEMCDVTFMTIPDAGQGRIYDICDECSPSRGRSL